MTYVYNPFISNLDDAGATGTGDIVGPGSSTDNAVAVWDGTDGDLLKDSAVLITGSGDIAANSIALTVSLPVADGGTGASTAGGARTNLGLVIGTDVQAWDTQLDDIAALTVTKGNLIGGDGTNWAALGVGADGLVLTADAAEVTGMKWAAAGGGASPLTTKGDVYTYDSADARIAVGTDGQVLTADSAQATGLVWATPTTGTVTSVSGTLNRVSSTGGATPVIDIDAAYVGQASITNLGTVTTGVWSGTDVAVTAGGTGASDAGTARTNLGVAIGSDVQAYDAGLADIAGLAVTDGNIIVGDGLNWVAENGATARTSLGLGSIATQDSNSVSITGGSVTGITDITVVDGGTGRSSATAYAVICGGTTSTASHQSVAALGASGTVLTSNGAAALPTFQVAGGGGLTWNEVTGTTQTAVADNGYITNNAGLVTVTLPATSAVGDVVRVAGQGAGGWKIDYTTNQLIHFLGTDSTTTTGSLASSNRYDAVELVASVITNEWNVISSVGNITIV